MGKSSSSSKKIKQSTDSSKLRSVKKKKTKRNKSKKIRRIKDYSDESESSGSDSSLYSSSEDDYRRKKKRSSKVSKKRFRKRYSSSESDDDDARVVKKKKISKRKDEHVGKKKKKKKKSVSRKKSKRDSSSSSTSSEQSDDGSESDGKRGSRERVRLGKDTDARRRSRDELEGDSEPDECWQVEDEVMIEKNPRRLKSIIVVSYTYDNDQRKEDMVDDHDDVYLTRGNYRELGYSDESDERDGETTIPYSRSRADNNGSKTVGYDEFFGESNKSGSSKASHLDNKMKDVDLEAILKQRALKNLKRFRGVNQKSGIARKEVSSFSEVEPLQIEFERVEESQENGLMAQKLCDSTRSKDLETSEKIVQVVNVKESGTVLAYVASQQDQQPGDSAKGKASSGISSCTTKRRLIRPILRQESLNLASRKEAAGCEDAEAESINGSTSDKNCLQSTLALSAKNGGESKELTKVNSSSHAETETLDVVEGGSQSEQKTTDETKDESQYEQKTMTVMRGGEMVQVSYKVYVPKKTPSLGRRQLKR